MLPAQLQRQATFQDRTPSGSFGSRPEGYTTPALGNHKVTHQAGGTDEISVSGLSGELADAQPPKAHGNAAHTSAFATEGYAVSAAVAEVDDHEGLADPHTGYVKHSLATAVSDFLVASGVGAFVKKTLAEVKTILGLGTAAFTAATDYAVAAKGVTNGDSHDHAGGDGAQVDHGGLAGLGDDDHTQYAPKASPTFTTKITTPQVQFPAAQSASADVNCLDDYEEGTWTPVFTGLTVVNGTGGATYSGTYTKVGRLVFFTVDIIVTGDCTTASTENVTTMGDIPFASSNKGVFSVTDNYAGVIGPGLVYSGNVFYPPTWSARNKNIHMTGFYVSST